MKENIGEMDDLPTVRVIRIGTICFEPLELASAFTQQIKADLGIGGGSTVTLIKGDRSILVDTGFDYEWLDTLSNSERNASNLVRVLKDWGVMPDNIDAVFITHWHRDHFGNLEVFKKAVRLASKGMVERFGLDGFEGIGDQEEIADGVRVMLTPGHTINHASIIVNSVVGGIRARVVIAGDAIVSHSYFQLGRIWRYNTDFYSAEDARESILKLINLSDIIIPGHGAPFMTYSPEMKRLTSNNVKRE